MRFQITLTSDHVAECGLVLFSELRDYAAKKRKKEERNQERKKERKKEESLVKYISPPTYYVGRPNKSFIGRYNRMNNIIYVN